VKAARNFAIIALVALAVVALPGGGGAADVAVTLISIAFFAAIAIFGYRMYREHHFTLDSLAPRERLVLYGSVGLAFLTFTASRMLFDEGGIGALAWIALLCLASYGVFWVWQQSRSFE
jgi:hypothetical protein